MKSFLAFLILVITLKLSHSIPLTATITWQVDADDLVCVYKNEIFIECGASQGAITLPGTPPADYTRFINPGDRITLKYTKDRLAHQQDFLIPYQVFLPQISKAPDI